MTIIEGAAMRCRTMADGSLRIEVEIEPRNAQAAFALFGAPGLAIALAALKDGSAAVKEPEPEKPKGGEWAKLAGMWCAEPDFWLWLNESFRMLTIVASEKSAADVVKSVCGISSRSQLDHSEVALVKFKAQIRAPFVEWMKKNGISK